MSVWMRILGVCLAIATGNAYAATTCTSTGNADWQSRAWNCKGTPPTGANVVIAAGTTIQADTNTNAVANVTINGTLQVQQGNTLTLTGNFANNGTFTAQAGSTVAFTGTNQTISGNVTFANLTVGANTVLTLTGNVVINGNTNLTAANLVSTCPTNYTVSTPAGVVIAQSCAGGAGGGATQSNCIPTTTAAGPTPVMAGAGQLSYGAGTTVNGGNGALAVSGALNGIPTTGATTNAGPVLPALTPATFPTANLGGGWLKTNGPVAPGSYGTITETGNPTVFSGGTYYIGTLNVSNAVQLNAGTYYINNLNLSKNSALTVNGAVQIYLGNNLQTNGSNVALNAGGNAGNLQINLYGNAQIDTQGNGGFSFTGLIYSPYSNAQVQIDGNNNSVTGAIITAGQVQLGANTAINFGPTVQSQLAALVCASGFDHLEIDHTGQALTCSGQLVTVKACLDAACKTLYTGGTVTGTLAPGGAAFTISNGSATAMVQQAAAGAATLAATAISPTPTAATQVTCLNTATNATGCANAMTFNSAGFVVTAPNHVACTDAVVTIEAMQAGTNNRCVPAYANVTRAVNLNLAYANPASGTLALTDITNNAQIGTTASAHKLAFDANGKATLSVGYPDVGQLTLTASDTAPTGAAMSGSGTFVAAPAALAIASVVPSPTIRAGSAFDVTVTASTGTGTVCPAAAAAPNFGHETPPQLALGHTLQQPTGAGVSDPALSASTFAALANGVKATQSWAEVGQLALTATLPGGSYLGYAAPLTATSAAQSFIPDHFDTAVVTTGVAPATVPMPCPAGLLCASGMVYSGQPFAVQVAARNAVGATTVNYQGAQARPVSLSGYAALGGTAAVAGTWSNNAVPATAFAGGVASALPAFAFGALAAPTDVYVRATDDIASVTSLRTPAANSVEGGVKVASGRIRIANAQGSELLPLPLAASVQYCAGVGPTGCNWLTSSTDYVTAFNTAANLTAAIVKGPLAGVSAQSPGPVTVSGGAANIVLNASHATGSADVALNAPAYLPGVAGRATFGIYKNNGEYIYVRESY